MPKASGSPLLSRNDYDLKVSSDIVKRLPDELLLTVPRRRCSFVSQGNELLEKVE